MGSETRLPRSACRVHADVAYGMLQGVVLIMIIIRWVHHTCFQPRLSLISGTLALAVPDRESLARSTQLLNSLRLPPLLLTYLLHIAQWSTLRWLRAPSPACLAYWRASSLATASKAPPLRLPPSPRWSNVRLLVHVCITCSISACLSACMLGVRLKGPLRALPALAHPCWRRRATEPPPLPFPVVPPLLATLLSSS